MKRKGNVLKFADEWGERDTGLTARKWVELVPRIETARKLIELIPPVTLKTVLGYLVLNYWEHRLGWPDLLVYRANQWFLAEVKSWSDKLNENQNRWIENNHRYLHLRFKLVQVHRMEFYVNGELSHSSCGACGCAPAFSLGSRPGEAAGAN